MLHHTRISTGCDDVTFLFSTLRLRHIHVKIVRVLSKDQPHTAVNEKVAVLSQMYQKKKYKIFLGEKTVCLFLCCILRAPGGERIVDIAPGGTELELQLRRGVGQAAHTRNNPHVKCTEVYCA